MMRHAAPGPRRVRNRGVRAKLFEGGEEAASTQPAVSQAIKRLEGELGDRLFDRSSRDGTLTEAGRLLQDYAGRLLTLAADAEQAVRELQEVRRGRVVIGANEAAVHSLLPVIASFGAAHPQVLIDVRRMASRHILRGHPRPHIARGADFRPGGTRAQTVSLGHDEGDLRIPAHKLAGRKRVSRRKWAPRP